MARYKCKNCNHDIVVDGTHKDKIDILHINYEDGLYNKCSFCDCTKPERKRPLIFCKNCGCEVRQRKGEWLHVREGYGPPCSYVRIGTVQRYSDIRSETACFNPQPIIPNNGDQQRDP